MARRKRPYTREELADQVGCSVGTIDNHRRKGSLESYKDSRDRRIVLIKASEGLRFARWYAERQAVAS